MCTRCVVDDIFAAACRAPFEVAELRDDGGVIEKSDRFGIKFGQRGLVHFFRGDLPARGVASPRDGGRLDGFQIRARPGTLAPIGPTIGGEAPEQRR
jgi:hypothetical protein